VKVEEKRKHLQSEHYVINEKYLYIKV